MEVGLFDSRRKSKCRVYCAVKDCKSKSNKDLNVVFHNFPKPGDRSVILENSEEVDKLNAWKNLLKINKVTPYMKVCSLHFKKSDYILPEYNSAKRFLKKNAIPSCNLPKSFGATNTNKHDTNKHEQSHLLIKLAMENAIKLAEKQCIPQNQPDIEMDTTIIKSEHDIDSVVANNNVGIENAESRVSIDVIPSTSSSGENEIGVQVETMYFSSTLMDLITNENDFSIATGIQSYKVLDTIIGMVKIVYGENLSNYKITLRDRIIMTYVKLKQNLSWNFLALIFKKCSAVLCERIFYATLKMLSKCLQTAIQWPSKEEISQNLPECFKDFENTRVIVDCIEIFIQPSNTLCSQELTEPNNKNSGTCKILIGGTPGGLISYFTKPYIGNTDTELFEQSDLIKLLEPGDAVMSDREFLIEELCTKNNWKLIKPPFTKDKITNAEVHVEKLKERIKEFSVLGETMPVKFVPVLYEVLTVVCATVNLNSPNFKNDKFMKE